MKNITDVVNNGLYRAAQESNRLKSLVSRHLPAELVTEILFLRAADQKLRITVSNSAWAARLRFHSRDIVKALAGDRTRIREVAVHVLPEHRRAKPSARHSSRRKPTATAQTVSTIRQVAKSMDEQKNGKDTLEQALDRLAQNLDRQRQESDLNS